MMQSKALQYFGFMFLTQFVSIHTKEESFSSRHFGLVSQSNVNEMFSYSGVEAAPSCDDPLDVDGLL